MPVVRGGRVVQRGEWLESGKVTVKMVPLLPELLSARPECVAKMPQQFTSWAVRVVKR